MNSDDEILARIGHRMPYRIPDGFLDGLDDRIMQQIGNTEPVSPRPRWLANAIYGIAASIAVVATVMHLTAKSDAECDLAQVDACFAQLTDNDRQFLIEVYQDELFTEFE